MLVGDVDVPHRRRHDDCVCAGDAGEVIDEYLKVPRVALGAAGRQASEALESAAAGGELAGGGGRGLFVVELALKVLGVCSDQGGQALEPVGGKGAPESHALVNRGAGDAVAVPPAEALRP